MKPEELLSTITPPEKIHKDCFTKEYYNTEQSLIDDLSCPDGEVCDLNIKKCVSVTDKDIIVPITIGDMIINIKGSNNIVDTLKRKIRALQPQITELVEDSISSEEKEVEIQSQISEDTKSFIPQKNPTLEEILEKMKSISGTKSATTSNQQKIKSLEKKALDKLRKCAGL
jgi:hypothetical protein